MSTLLLDASVVLAAFDSDDDLHDAAKAIFASPRVTLATLDLARYEVANVAVRAWREPAQVSQLLEAIDRVSDDGGVTPSTTTLLSRAAEIAEQHTISVYDAAYVAAAAQAGATLVSCDTRDLIDKELASSPAEMADSLQASPTDGEREARRSSK